jgi:uncharacterized protein (DUF2236 family)
MSSTRFPHPDELPSLVPGSHSVSWRVFGDARSLSAAGYALLLQVAHPTVGAGVTEHSNFRADPWGRLWRTLDYVALSVYAGPQRAGATGQRIHEMHRPIKGVKPDGMRYHALESEAYAWVHATLAIAGVEGTRRFVRPLRADQLEAFWAEWRALGRTLGIRDRELPRDWTAFTAYYERMVAERLERTSAFDEVLETIGGPVPPPSFVPAGAWRAIQPIALRGVRQAGLWMLPASLRARFGLRWSRAEELEMRALARASRAATPLMPRQIRRSGEEYLRLRGPALTPFDSAGTAPNASASTVAVPGAPA